MSLLEELESRGVTAEDLEKAASVRLFEKAAAAEGVDLDSLDVDQVEELYAAFLSNPSYDDNTPTKEASAMNDEIVDLFEKTAASEGIDLDDMADAELAELYNHYVENVLPLQIEEYEKGASYDEVDEATEKLAEAEILGRHMARAYMDEMDKQASGIIDIDLDNMSAAELLDLQEQGYEFLDEDDLYKEAKVSRAEKARRKRMVAEAGGMKPEEAAKKYVEGGSKKPQKGGFRQFSERVSKKAKETKAVEREAKARKGRVSAARQSIRSQYNKRIAQPFGKASLTTGRALGISNRRMARRVGGGVLGAGALAAGGLGVMGARKALGTDKRASAFDDLVYDEAAELAAEWLVENGYEV